MDEPQRYECTLSADDAPRRLGQVRALARGVLNRESGQREARIVFEPALATLVREFARDESGCCSFFELAVHERDDAVELVASAPAGAEGMLRSLLDAFGPDAGSA